jgi:hypothetical protein
MRAPLVDDAGREIQCVLVRRAPHDQVLVRLGGVSFEDLLLRWGSEESGGFTFAVLLVALVVSMVVLTAHGLLEDLLPRWNTRGAGPIWRLITTTHQSVS